LLNENNKGLTLAQVPEEGGPGEASIIRSVNINFNNF